MKPAVAGPQWAPLRHRDLLPLPLGDTSKHTFASAGRRSGSSRQLARCARRHRGLDLMVDDAVISVNALGCARA
eukprot:1603125-Heterocapsa_arctica.AAC.1